MIEKYFGLRTGTKKGATGVIIGAPVSAFFTLLIWFEISGATELNSDKVTRCTITTQENVAACTDDNGKVYLCDFENNRPTLCQLINHD